MFNKNLNINKIYRIMKKCKSIFAIDNILKGKYPIRLNIFEIS